MGLWSTLKQHAGAQFLDVIEWLDDSNDTLVYRFPIFNQAITSNSKLVVREGQQALFVSEGKLSEPFAPGTYTLDTRNTPIASFFTSIAYALNYPYKGDVYFCSTRTFTDNKWGTPQPVMLRDAEFGMVRLRAHGIYAFKISDPGTFLRQVVGTDGLFTRDEITGQFKQKLAGLFGEALGQARIPALDVAANYGAIGDRILENINPKFESQFGVTLTDFTIVSVTVPPEVEKAIDTRSKMAAIGNLDAYAKMHAAEAIPIAAANPGLTGTAVGMGVGFGMGNVIGGQFAQGMQSGAHYNPHSGMQAPAVSAPPPLPGATRFHYNGPSGQSQLTIDEIAQRVVADRGADHLVWQAGWPEWKSWKDVAPIAGAVPPAAAAPPPLPGGNVRFNYHGPAGDGDKSAAEVAAIVAADPDADHYVWKAGFDGWKPAKDVPEIVAAGNGGAPPPPPKRR